MSKNKRNMPTAATIAKHHCCGRLLLHADVCDAAELATVCWACGERSKPQRCHIVPKADGGADTADNLLLLCDLCHHEQPDVAPESMQWAWLYSRKSNVARNFDSAREVVALLEAALGRPLSTSDIEPAMHGLKTSKRSDKLTARASLKTIEANRRAAIASAMLSGIQALGNR